ncbi:MAG: PHB depolymerase family esterase [Comamonadaceae bacterium]|nr:MAG: PHB depolymerase family esterase [Comamonadaceae bacterium]
MDAEPMAQARNRAHAADPSAASREPPGSSTSSSSASSAATATPERWLDGHFTHGSRALTYKLYIPPALAAEVATSRPLVVMLHGCTQGAADFAAGTQMNALARQHGVIVLYPEQAQRANAQRCWNWFKPQHQRRGQGEPAALEALVRQVMTEHAVDATRVFVAGLSAGGAMADILGQCYPDTFAGVGVHSGLPAGAASDVAAALSVMRTGPRAAPPRGAAAAVPTIVFHGDADMTVHERNGRAVVEAAKASTSGAGGPSAESRTVKGHSAHGQAFTQTLYANCQGHTQIEHWQLHGAGHAWSGGSAQGSYTHPSGVDASAEMLRFFLSLPRRPRPVDGTH